MLTKFRTELHSRLNFGNILSSRLLKKVTKDKNGQNVPLLEIAEVVLVLCNVFNNQWVLPTSVPIKSLNISSISHI